MICKTDEEWQRAIKRDGMLCPMCGQRRATHAHHLISRGVKRYKRDTRNGVAVCAECHLSPARILEWVRKYRPAQYAWVVTHKYKTISAAQRKLEQ